MSMKKIIPLLLICFFSLSCSTKRQDPAKINVTFGEGVDPNSFAIVTLKLEGETIHGQLKVVPAEDTSSAMFDRMGNSEDVRQVGEHTWVAILSPGESYVMGWIVEDKELFGYCSEPFVAENDLEVKFSPGMPLTLEYDLTKPEEGVKVFPVGITISRKTVTNGKVSLISWGVTELVEEPRIVKISGFAEGTYQIFASALTVSEEDMNLRNRFLNDKRYVEIKADSNNYFEAEYPELDTTIEEGDLNIKGIVINSAGEILSDETIKLVPYDNDNKAMVDLYYPFVVTDANGYFEFTGVRPNTTYIVKGGNSGISLYKSITKKDSTFWLNLILGATNLPLTMGEMLPEFVIDWKDAQSGNLLDLYGKFIVIEVWASWCEPSIDKLRELNSLAEEFKENENVIFMALSVDGNRDNWLNAVNNADLSALRHGWYNNIENLLVFNRPLSYVMILDNRGLLRAAGSWLDIKEELEKVIEASK